MLIHTPLEQFSIISLIPFHVGNLYLSFTNSSLFLLATITLLYILFYMTTRKGGSLVPSRWQSFVEMIYEFVVSLVDEQIGSKGRKFFPNFCFILNFFNGWVGRILIKNQNEMNLKKQKKKHFYLKFVNFLITFN